MVSSAERRPVAPEDLFKLAIVQDARLSPDGRSVVYALAAFDDQGEKEHAALWLLTLDSGETRQLTAGRGRDSSPVWSPDGGRIAFRSNRDGKAQLYVIPVDGGEARAVTNMEQGVGGEPIWSPDGSRLAFTAANAEPPDLSKPYRITRRIIRFDALGYLDGAVQSVYMVDVAGGEPTRLTDDGRHYALQGWSPDGAQILALAMMHPASNIGYFAQLCTISTAGEIRDLCVEWGAATAAAWSADGSQIIFYGSAFDRPAGAKSDLWLVDRAGGMPHCRSADLFYHPGAGLQDDSAVQHPLRLLPSSDGTHVYAQVQAGGSVQIYRVALSGREECTPLIAGDRSCFPLDLVGDRLLFAVSTLANPLDLYLADLSNGDERRLTQVNAAVTDTWALGAVEHLQFNGSDGAPVEGWLMRPPGGDGPYPTILYIHGGPHSGFGHIFSFDFQLLAGAGYGVLFINQRGSTGYGEPFASAIIGDWGNLDYHDLMAGVDTAIERGLADPERLGVCGLSGGGNLSCWIIGQTRRFKAAVPENPVTNWVSFYGVSDIGPWFAVRELGGLPHEIPDIYRRCSPITYAHTCTTPTLLIQGEADYRCPAEQAEQFYAVLRANGCVAEMLRLPGGSHAASIVGDPAIRRVHNEALLEWMHRYVRGE
ncbi:MAG: S9 family peptidase [Oscillochloris sp.]|nr:S9 family peptidase [Oscillochloris sp.]